jgi:hypothetical protein
MEEYARQLTSKKVSSTHLAERDTSKMDGEKYKEQHENTKSIISTCAKTVNAQKNQLVSAMAMAGVSYNIKINSLKHAYTVACANEERERARIRKEAEDRAKKNK